MDGDGSTGIRLMMMYQFRREDNGEIVQVSFEKMMEKDITGTITLNDGMTAVQVNRGPSTKTASLSVSKCDSARDQKHVSDSMGVTAKRVVEFQAEAIAAGFTGIEFRPDPLQPKFYQCVSSCPTQMKKYIKHRGMFDKNGSISSCVHLSEADLERARRMVSRGRGEGIVT
jgi:hypothetical protein